MGRRFPHFGAMTAAQARAAQHPGNSGLGEQRCSPVCLEIPVWCRGYVWSGSGAGPLAGARRVWDSSGERRADYPAVSSICSARLASSETRVPRALAIRWTVDHEGFRRPFSMCESHEGSMSASSATASWLSPFSVRSSRIARPSAACGLGLARRGGMRGKPGLRFPLAPCIRTQVRWFVAAGGPAGSGGCLLEVARRRNPMSRPSTSSERGWLPEAAARSASCGTPVDRRPVGDAGVGGRLARHVGWPRVPAVALPAWCSGAVADAIAVLKTDVARAATLEAPVGRPKEAIPVA